MIRVEDKVRIPTGIDTLDAFRRWARSPDFPARGRFAFLAGDLWIDLTVEDLFLHNRVKTCVTADWHALVAAEDLGYCFSDGVLLTNIAAGLGTEPDGLFASYDAVTEGRVEFVEEDGGDHCLEVTGSPDAVLEVVSATSVTKDTEDLFRLYWRAGIPEYWLIDARAEHLHFAIYRHGPRGYVATRRQDGALRSRVFGRSFQLNRRTDRLDRPDFVLAHR
jgi:Uma2 family endonuclease